ncbi:ribonuclease III, partial [Clavulina sp. PMI_390]
LMLSPEFPLGLPSLPPIHDDALRQQAFTHRSHLSRSIDPFSDSSYPRDYESLEHLGDSVLNLCVTDIIRKKYPNLRPGGATVVRSKIINNANLATVASRYEFGPRMLISSAQAIVLRESPSLLADMFEAYVGAIYTESGFAITHTFLTELFTPYARLAYDEAFAEHNLSDASKSPSDASSASNPNGAVMQLNQLLQRAGFPPVVWVETLDGVGANAQWTMDAIIEGKHVGTGTARSKARAKNLAAEEAL